MNAPGRRDGRGGEHAGRDREHAGPDPEHDGHGHDLDVRSATVRRVLVATVVAVAVVAAVGLVVLWPRGDAVLETEVLGFNELVEATVVATEIAPCSYDPDSECIGVTARITSGDERGQEVDMETDIDANVPLARLDLGDRLVLNDAGPSVPDIARYSFADIQRRGPLLGLTVLFAVAVVALGRWRGFFALIGLALTFLTLISFVLPAMDRGTNPVAVALVGATVIALIALYLAHGFTLNTTVALLGTLVSLAITAGLGLIFARWASLSGLASEEASNLLAFAPELDFRGLLLAAIIIGSLGVLDDVTVTQVSAVNELRRAQPELSARELYGAGVRIGRDHIASTVNTLVLAYAAAALPLLLIFTQSGLGIINVVTSETVAVEIVQTFVGSIGLVASVPITTALAALVVRAD